MSLKTVENIAVRPSRWHSGRLIYALAYHFDWFQNSMMTEFFVDGGIADLVFISRAGYLTEIEVKISLADWKADSSKRKWLKERPSVARFFYAVPATLVDSIPSWVPEHAGILAISASLTGGHDIVREVRAAKRQKAQKVRPEALASACYHRYWRLRLNIMRQRLSTQFSQEAQS